MISFEDQNITRISFKSMYFRRAAALFVWSSTRRLGDIDLDVAMFDVVQVLPKFYLYGFAIFVCLPVLFDDRMGTFSQSYQVVGTSSTWMPGKF